MLFFWTYKVCDASKKTPTPKLHNDQKLLIIIIFTSHMAFMVRLHQMFLEVEKDGKKLEKVDYDY